jgi:hypothetical protein
MERFLNGNLIVPSGETPDGAGRGKIDRLNCVMVENKRRAKMEGEGKEKM